MSQNSPTPSGVFALSKREKPEGTANDRSMSPLAPHLASCNITTSSATAPVVGRHHKKSNSLVGFDPLLEIKEDVPGLDKIANGSQQDKKQTGLATPPLLPQQDSRSPEMSPNQLSSELRLLATEIDKASPVAPNSAGRLKKKSFLLGGANNANKLPSLPWKKGHRKSHSMTSAGVGGTTNDVFSMAISSPSKPTTVSRGRTVAALVSHSAGSTASLTSPMMQELWYSSSNGSSIKEALSMPSLAKPRATSFLTGKEFVRSSEQEATEWQLQIPEKSEFLVAARLCQFLETYYRGEDPCLDLGSLAGYNNMDLQQFAQGSHICGTIDPAHRSTVQSLLGCGADILQVRGHMISGNDADDTGNLDNRREFLILERQHLLVCVFRGTKAEQQGKFSKQSEIMTLKESEEVSVFADRLLALSEMEKEAFSILDQLSEESPFCDVIFVGHSFGAAMATLAAYRYAAGRPELRVEALTTSCPKVGMENLRLSAHSLPNLKVMRVELGNARSHASHGGSHIGHTIRVNPSALSSKLGVQHNALVKAYKFGDCTSESNVAVRTFFKRDRDIADYVDSLAAIQQWVQDFHREDGAGVKGEDNESRQMV